MLLATAVGYCRRVERYSRHQPNYAPARVRRSPAETPFFVSLHLPLRLSQACLGKKTGLLEEIRAFLRFYRTTRRTRAP